MNPVLKVILNSLVKYLQAHPEQVEKLVEALVAHLIESFVPPQA